MPEWGHDGWILKGPDDPIDFQPGDKIIYQLESELIDTAVELGWVTYDSFFDNASAHQMNNNSQYYRNIKAYKIMRLK